VRQTLRGRLDLRLSGINAIYERWIRIQSDTIPGLSDTIIENRKAMIDLMAGGFTMDFIKADPNIDAWSTSEESTGDGNVRIPPSRSLPVPQNVTVTAERVGSNTFLDIQIDDPSRNDLSIVVNYRIQDIGSSTPGKWVSQVFDPPDYVAGRGTVTILSVVPDSAYDVRVAFRATAATVGAFSAIITVSTLGTAPGSPTGLNAVGAAGHVTISWVNPNSTNMYAARVWRTALGDVFAHATDVSGRRFGAANQAMSFTNTASPGAYYYWVTAESSGGNQSTPTGPDSATVT
jgi:hypothetical protein